MGSTGSETGNSEMDRIEYLPLGNALAISTSLTLVGRPGEYHTCHVPSVQDDI